MKTTQNHTQIPYDMAEVPNGNENLCSRVFKMVHNAGNLDGIRDTKHKVTADVLRWHFEKPRVLRRGVNVAKVTCSFRQGPSGVSNLRATEVWLLPT